MKEPMWCIYSLSGKNKKVYDLSSLACSRKESIDKFVDATIGLSWHDYQILWGWQIEKVYVIIQSR